jgi:hypothetical protein
MNKEDEEKRKDWGGSWRGGRRGFFATLGVMAAGAALPKSQGYFVGVDLATAKDRTVFVNGERLDGVQEYRTFLIDDVCRAFGVPKHLVVFRVP